ncbi:MAG: hypothetical protein EOM02_00630 [Synergistales bacterium]|nr:hypothetical protein [Dethiosulfovibrio sp.]NCC95324.1 hypothetical protein [Synergistales bacterium]
MVDFSVLSRPWDIWDCWRFEPWADQGMEGVFRRVTFIKAGLMGEVARYCADDYIVWRYDPSSIDLVRKTWPPIKDTMIQRVIFISPVDRFEKKVKAFALGFRGYLETYSYAPMGQGYRKIKDLTPLIDKAWESVKHDSEEGGVGSVTVAGVV